MACSTQILGDQHLEVTIKADIDHPITQALELQSVAIAEVGPEQVEVIRLEMTVLENLKRIARKFVPQEIHG